MSDGDIELTATGWTVSASEKTSTGEYENHESHAALEGDIPLGTRLDEDARRELKARLLALQKDLQEVVERAAENRVRESGHEDWGVPKTTPGGEGE